MNESHSQTPLFDNRRATYGQPLNEAAKAVIAARSAAASPVNESPKPGARSVTFETLPGRGSVRLRFTTSVARDCEALHWGANGGSPIYCWAWRLSEPSSSRSLVVVTEARYLELEAELGDEAEDLYITDELLELGGTAFAQLLQLAEQALRA